MQDRDDYHGLVRTGSKEVAKMIIRPSVLCAGLILLLCSTVLQAHQVASGNHQHVWRPTTYGKDYRPGHSVNGPTGSITIWSPAAFNKYGASNSVQFAHPAPFDKQLTEQSAKLVQSQSNVPQLVIPQSNIHQSNIPRIKSLAPSQYGKVSKRD
jgi:hypothetical protein